MTYSAPLMTFRRATRWGDGYVFSAGSTLEQIRERIIFYRHALRELGHNPDEKVIAINRVMHVVKDRAAKVQVEQCFS